jgi:hypothetical protein
MSDYVKSTNFYVKDSLLVGNPDKIVKGSELDTEFNNIATAVSSKANYASPNLTGLPTAPTAATGTNTAQLATTAFVKSAVDANSANVNITGGTIDDVDITGGTIKDLDEPLAVNSGGTGKNTLALNNVLLGNGTAAVKVVAPGVAGTALVSNGTEWVAGGGMVATLGDAPYYGARAWVNFNGTTSPPTIKASGNVSSVTKNSTGDYTINFTVALPDANYCVSTNQTTGSASNSGQGLYVIGDIVAGATLKTTTQLRVGTWPNILQQLDYADCYVVVFR